MSVLAGYVDVLGIVIGVVCCLAGLGLVLMGLIGVANRQIRRGLVGAAAGVALAAIGFWLVGVTG